MTAVRATDAGFTLIETLVALAVLALTSVGLLAATEAHIARTAGLETRAAALWAAENHLAEIALGLPADTQPEMLGLLFDISVTSEATSDPDVQKLTLSARLADTGGTVPANVARLTGFVLTDALGGTQ